LQSPRNETGHILQIAGRMSDREFESELVNLPPQDRVAKNMELIDWANDMETLSKRETTSSASHREPEQNTPATRSICALRPHCQPTQTRR
jgi:hypothetical protein